MRARTTDILERIRSEPPLRALASRIRDGGDVTAFGGSGSSTTLAVGALARELGRTVFYAVAHLDEADEAADELTAHGVEALRFPALEILPGETGVSDDLFAERLSVARKLIASRDGARVVVCPIAALMQGVTARDRLDELCLRLETGGEVPLEAVARWLADAGFNRMDSVEEPGDFAVRGGIVDILTRGSTVETVTPDGKRASESTPGAGVRLDFFGDEIESIHEIDTDTMGSDRRLEAVELYGTGAIAERDFTGKDVVSLFEYADADDVAVIRDLHELTEQGRAYHDRAIDGGGIFGVPAVMRTMRERTASVVQASEMGGSSDSGAVELPVGKLREFSNDVGEAVGELAEIAGECELIVACQNEGEASRLGELVAEFAPGARIGSIQRYVHRGFVWEGETPFAVVAYHELLHRYQVRRKSKAGLKRASQSEAFLGFEPGDLVVHADHGIAKYHGLAQMDAKQSRRTSEEHADAVLKAHASKSKKKAQIAKEEYLLLEFAGKSRLYVPVFQAQKVQKYIGGFSGKPKLSSMGGKRWKNQKEQVKEAVRDLASELLRVQAARESLPGVRYPHDTAWQKEFEAEFPYDETEDQLRAIDEIKGDMQGDRPTDRLICGDVGYGKTEVAIRAAFKAVEFGKQVAVLVPTTLLAEQHERTFRQRFADYPFTVASLSRFKTRGEQNEVLKRLASGKVDVIIGTHRLLSKDVTFADLGLVVIDEEQRFGVEHKNELLRLRMTAEVITLSATPIPRTLHMAMLGLRDISSLTTAPVDRRSVVTEVMPFNETRIERAIRRELARDGQVFFVHNRVHNIKSVADDVRRLVPEARVIVGHGQMGAGELEEVMRAFINREADILVSTTIIESGIDIPTANTMFIADADRFGLADLHQMRGRVGRYKHRAYCYLLLPENRTLTDVAKKRLHAIEEFSMLGSGFKIAMRDLEIRGAGNLLGAEQSGHIASVGYDMYCRLLEGAAKELKGEAPVKEDMPTVEIGVTGTLSRRFIPSESRRLEAYRRIAEARSFDALEHVERDLRAAYGELPDAARALIDLAEVRIGASMRGVRSLVVRERDVILRTDDPVAVRAMFEGAEGTLRVVETRGTDAIREVYYRPPETYLEPATLLAVLRNRVRGGALVAS